MKPSETRRKILEAALSLFSEHGYLGATTKEIAKSAGVAELTLFRHFPGKEALFEAVLQGYTFLPELKGMLPEIVAMPYEEALRAIAARFLDKLDQRKEMVRIIYSEIRRYPGKIQQIYRAFVDETIRTLARYFDRLQREGLLREFDSELGARAFLGMFLSYFNAQELLLGRKHRPEDRENVIAVYVGFFARGTVGTGVVRGCSGPVKPGRALRGGGAPGERRRARRSPGSGLTMAREGEG